MKKHQPQAIKKDFQSLRTENQLQENYAVELSNKYNILLTKVDSDSTTIKYEKLLEAIYSTTAKLLKSAHWHKPQ